MKSALPFHEDPNQWVAYARNLVKHRTGSPEEIDDAVQAGIMRMMPALGRVDPSRPKEAIRGYLRQFILRGIEEHFQRWREQPAEDVIERSDGGRAVAAIDAADQRRRALHALRHLPNLHRQVVARIIWRERSKHEIAAELGCTVDHVAELHKRGMELITINLAGGRSDRRRTRMKIRPQRVIGPFVETRGRKRAMARQRIVRPEDFTDVPSESFTATWHLFWLGLRTRADVKGLFEWSPSKLKAAILPHYQADVSAILNGLLMAGVVRRYESGGKSYGWIVGFDRQSGFDRKELAAGPRYPQPNFPDYTTWEPPQKS